MPANYNLVDHDGLEYAIGEIATQIKSKYVSKANEKTALSQFTNDANYVADASYVHTDNNYTTIEKNKLQAIEAGAEVNVIEEVQVNGTALVPSSKSVNIVVPAAKTALSEFTNDVGFQTATQVENAIDIKIATAYKASGSIAFASLPTLASTNQGKVYNITDSFTTTADFLEGAGKTYGPGANVAIVLASTSPDVYKYDVMADFVDLSGYVEFSDITSVTNAEIDDMIEEAFEDE